MPKSKQQHPESAKSNNSVGDQAKFSVTLPKMSATVEAVVENCVDLD